MDFFEWSHFVCQSTDSAAASGVDKDLWSCYLDTTVADSSCKDAFSLLNTDGRSDGFASDESVRLAFVGDAVVPCYLAVWSSNTSMREFTGNDKVLHLHRDLALFDVSWLCRIFSSRFILWATIPGASRCLFRPTQLTMCRTTRCLRCSVTAELVL